MNLELELKRDGDKPLNYGKLIAGGAVLVGQTLEDTDRRLEDGGVKIPGDTAVPRGRYRVTINHSNRFDRLMPEVLGVPDFTGIRIHGGNTVADTHGCPLLGSSRTPTGVKGCAEPNARLMAMLTATVARGDEVWLTVS